MTKYVVSGYIGFDNFGDEAIAKIFEMRKEKYYQGDLYVQDC